ALAELRAKLVGWQASVRRVIDQADPTDITVTDIQDRDPRTEWARGRVVVIGDAAHPMVPAMGQGANMALEDAVVLAEYLRETDVAQGLRNFAEVRSPRTTEVVLQSRRQGEFDQGAGRVEAFLRDMTMRVRGSKDTDVSGLLEWAPSAR
ncbi:FAD-dependent monooxygenase, partial [Nocardia gipuzkoensis]